MSPASILIVEDKRIIAMDIQNSLESLGYTVCASVSSGEEAIRKAEECHPDLVLMDILLEGDMDGIQAARQIHERLNIPIIYLTAYADEYTLQQAKLTEPYAYLVKPFEERELHTTIEIAFHKHKREMKLRENERWLSTTLNSIGDGVIATDAEMSVKLINPVAQKLTGWERDQALSESLTKVFHIVPPENEENFESPIKKAIENRETVIFPKDCILIAKDGTERIIDGNIAPICNGENDIRGIVMVFRDLTEKRRIEEELLRIQKLESVGILAGTIAHDFNNILTTIIGYISLAKIDAGREDAISEKLERAKDACLTARELTQQLLSFSKGGTPLRETGFITKIIRDAVNLARKSVFVQCDLAIPNDLWPLEIDKGQIRQAICNLITNLGQLTSGEGTIQVQVENFTLDPGHKLPLKPGKYVKITIKGQGATMPEEYLHKMFDPYFLIRQGEKGLSLITVSSIIHGHKGFITTESHPDTGTKIRIYLPASEKEVVETKYLEGNYPVGKGRVLLMDDEEMVRDAVGRVLQYLGYEVELADEGIEAIQLYQKAQKRGEKFDAVIIDLTVSKGMGGRETIKRLMEIDPEVKAIVSSGYVNDPIMLEFKNYGFVDVVAKPYQIEELSSTLHKVILAD